MAPRFRENPARYQYFAITLCLHVHMLMFVVCRYNFPTQPFCLSTHMTRHWGAGRSLVWTTSFLSTWAVQDWWKRSQWVSAKLSRYIKRVLCFNASNLCVPNDSHVCTVNTDCLIHNSNCILDLHSDFLFEYII